MGSVDGASQKFPSWQPQSDRSDVSSDHFESESFSSDGRPYLSPFSTSTNRDSSARQRDIDLASDALPMEATLAQRLDVWRNAPGGRGEIPGEIELGGFNLWNLEVSAA